jgi:hypothetical protein
MSFLGGGNSGGQTQNVVAEPYKPAQPALNQIISEAGNLYNQGVGAAGYVYLQCYKVQQMRLQQRLILSLAVQEELQVHQ